MLSNVPNYIVIIFLLIVALTFYLFVRSARNRSGPRVVLLLWLALTGFLALIGVFENTAATPPRLALIMIPALVIVILMLTKKDGRSFSDSLDLRKLTMVHVVRIPVEIVLYLLADHKLIPVLMTFEGRNFDILSGITAPIMYFACFRNAQLKDRKLLLTWNLICLALLINILINAILSLPYPFQQFAFDQPNVAVLYFPFIWLPAFIVVIVLYSHLAAIRELHKKPAHHAD